MWSRGQRMAHAVLLGSQALGCQLIEAADKIHDQFDSDEDETIRLSVPEPVAAGATFEARVLDACTDRAKRCESDSIEVTQVVVDGPFVTEAFDGDTVVLRSTGAGEGLVDVTVDMDGASPSAIADLRAGEVLDVALAPDCVGEASRWVAPAQTLPMAYTLFGFREQLAGTLEPPVETTLVLERLGEPGEATYRTPEAPGPVPVTSAIDGTTLLSLEVFDADQVLPELIAPTRMSGSLLYFDIEQRVDGARPCTESEDALVVQSETPSVCLIQDGGDSVVEAGAQVGRTLRVDVVRAGTCTVSIGRDGRGVEITRDFTVEGP